MKIEEQRKAFDGFIRGKYAESVLWNNGVPTHPLYADLYESWLASANREGFKLVPVEPTELMLNKARDWSVEKYGQGVGNDGARGCYKAMIGACGD